MVQLHLAGQNWCVVPHRELGPQVQHQAEFAGEHRHCGLSVLALPFHTQTMRTVSQC